MCILSNQPSLHCFPLHLINLVCTHDRYFSSFLHINPSPLSFTGVCLPGCHSVINHPPPHSLFFAKQVSGQLCSSSRGGHRGALRPVCGAHTVQDMEAHEKLPLPKYVHMSFDTRHAEWQQRLMLVHLCLPTDITSMTFDPDTAHPSLSISESRTSVWFEEDKDTEDCPVSPRRFHYYYCVLGHQGFTTGRHYWEVEVGQKTAWRLGVAREDVPRGEMDASGTSNGLWTLALKGGAILACTDPKPTKVNVSVRLVRIGVFLDCEKEEVSFYNAITMAPIYTFTMGTVLVPLFPFYNPCDTDDGKNTAAITVFHPSLWQTVVDSCYTDGQTGQKPSYKNLNQYTEINNRAADLFVLPSCTWEFADFLLCYTKNLICGTKEGIWRPRCRKHISHYFLSHFIINRIRWENNWQLYSYLRYINKNLELVPLFHQTMTLPHWKLRFHLIALLA